MKIEKRVTVVIEGNELVALLVKALVPEAETSTGREAVMFRAFSYLVGRTAVEAVRLGNRYARDCALPTITTDEFRKWLPKMLSEAFKELVGND